MIESARVDDDVDAVLEWLSPRLDERRAVAVALSPQGFVLAAIEPSPPGSDTPGSGAPGSSTSGSGAPGSGTPGSELDQPTVTTLGCATTSSTSYLQQIEATLAPRWVWWNRATPADLVHRGVRINRCWDVVAMQALIRGGGPRSAAQVWCELTGLNEASAPTLGQMALLGSGSPSPKPADSALPVSEWSGRLLDGYLRPEWVADPSNLNLENARSWAATALVASQLQRSLLGRADQPARRLQTAHSESAAELLCAELADRGLPFDTDRANEIIEQASGPRPADQADADRQRAARDAAVLELAPPGRDVDLRNPSDVKELLRRIDLDLPDTRAGRLRPHIDHHRLVPALLAWRKAERLSTTYGYQWMDTHVADGRLRGSWSSYDGAAGRMTASAGLHNLPAELRPAVVAEPGHVFVRADLGQIEPRVLAAVSGDPALTGATTDRDLYHSIAQRLRVDRPIAKLAVLGAMYGSTTGEAANALRRLDREYPIAMGYLSEAASQGRDGHTVYTIGGRPVHMWESEDTDGDIDRARRIAAARGRFARNAVIQGAAAEFFKMWAVTVRARTAPLRGEVVLCLHDELLVHVPTDDAPLVARAVDDAVDEVAERWSPQPDVRFVSETSIVACWADAK